MTDDEFLNDRDCKTKPQADTPRVDALRNSSDHPTPAGELWQLAYDLERELARALRVVEAAQAFASIEFHPELDKALREWEAGR